MARRPKTTEEQWYDLFADADVSEQVIMLQILNGIHRQARRGKLTNGKPAADKPAAEPEREHDHDFPQLDLGDR